MTDDAPPQLDTLLDSGNALADSAVQVLLVMCNQTYSDPDWDKKRRMLLGAIDDWRSAADPSRVSPISGSRSGKEQRVYATAEGRDKTNTSGTDTCT